MKKVRKKSIFNWTLGIRAPEAHCTCPLGGPPLVPPSLAPLKPVFRHIAEIPPPSVPLAICFYQKYTSQNFWGTQCREKNNAPPPVSLLVLPSLFKSSSGVLLLLGTSTFSLDQQEGETNQPNKTTSPFQSAPVLAPDQQITHREALSVQSSWSSHLLHLTIWKQELVSPFHDPRVHHKVCPRRKPQASCKNDSIPRSCKKDREEILQKNLVPAACGPRALTKALWDDCFPHFVDVNNTLSTVSSQVTVKVAKQTCNQSEFSPPNSTWKRHIPSPSPHESLVSPVPSQHPGQ